ncbi:MAG: CvpA family protein [Rhodospirillaceae bacterium]|nr:CvpA family protein [Rhodospirillaceae bacterium]
MSFTVLDFIFVVVVLLSTILAFVRGLMRELFTLAAWAGAALAAWFLLPHTEPYARQVIDDKLVAQIIAATVVFIVAIIVITLLASLITDRIRQSRLGLIDRILGSLFGALRGVVLVVLGYVALTLVYPDDSKIPWIRDALSKPYLHLGREVTERLLPEGVIQPGPGAVRNLPEGTDIKK